MFDLDKEIGENKLKISNQSFFKQIIASDLFARPLQKLSFKLYDYDLEPYSFFFEKCFQIKCLENIIEFEQHNKDSEPSLEIDCDG